MSKARTPPPQLTVQHLVQMLKSLLEIPWLSAEGKLVAIAVWAFHHGGGNPDGTVLDLDPYVIARETGVPVETVVGAMLDLSDAGILRIDSWDPTVTVSS